MAQVLEAAPDFWEGRTLVQEKYRLDRYLTGTSNGRVYEGVHLALERPVRIKLLDASHAHDDQLITRFTKEARAAARIDHPSVVRVLDFGREPDGPFYLVSEQLDGKSLDEVIEENGPFDFQEGFDLILEVIAGVAEAHERGVFHRNLTPDAILVATDRDSLGRRRHRPKLTDFDLAKLAFQPTTATLDLLPGNPRFMAPEQYRGEAPDARADVYALCCLVYVTLTGKPPFTGKNAIEILHQHAHADPPSLGPYFGSEVPLLDRVLARGLAKAPTNRIENGRALLEELRRAVIETPTPAPREEPVTETGVKVDIDIVDNVVEAPTGFHSSPALSLVLRAGGVILLAVVVGVLAWWVTVTLLKG